MIGGTAVNGQAADVLRMVRSGCAGGGDLEGFAARKRDHDPIEQRRVQAENRRARSTRIEAEGGPNVPAGHRPEIVVARLTVGCWTE